VLIQGVFRLASARGCKLFLEGPFQLAGLREPSQGLFGEQLLVTELDLEGAAAALDQTGGQVELLFDLGRQTGGAGVVVSLHAVFDGQRLAHRDSPPDAM